MKLVGTTGQSQRDALFAISGSIATGGTPQLVLPEDFKRGFLMIRNTGSSTLYFEFGSARATCSISGGAVSGTTITNAGFGFTRPPKVLFVGGGGTGDGLFLGGNLPGALSPPHCATGHAVLTGNAVSSIVIDDPGNGYIIAPYVFIQNDEHDPYGCAAPSTTSGISLLPGDDIRFDASRCPTDSVAVYGATTGATYDVRWME